MLKLERCREFVKGKSEVLHARHRMYILVFSTSWNQVKRRKRVQFANLEGRTVAVMTTAGL